MGDGPREPRAAASPKTLTTRRRKRYLRYLASVSGESSMALASGGESRPQGAPIGGRFRVDALLGRGGMAVVYRVTELATGRALALKQLAVPADASGRQDQVALFEREFLTLTQLSHPRVIEVYDYGIDDAAP